MEKLWSNKVVVKMSIKIRHNNSDAKHFWSQSLRKIFKGVPKDNFHNFIIFSTKTKGIKGKKIFKLQL
jgi:hypothetical protein